MRIVRLAAQGFRNLEPFSLATDATFVVLHGENAQGKTNTLEAVYLVATLKGLRTHLSKQLVGWGEDTATVVADVRRDSEIRRHRVELSGKGRRITVDDAVPPALSDYFLGIRAVSFRPADVEIVSGEPSNRRSWLDRAAFTAAPAHLDVVRQHQRLVQQKGALLRADRVDRGLLSALGEGLAQAGAELAQRRQAILDQLAPQAEAQYAAISGRKVRVRLRYRTCTGEGDLAARRDALLAAMRERRDEELRRGMVLVGPQRDDVLVELDGRSLRRYGSQGQVRTAVLALKLAELAAARGRGDAPTFLLDDVGSELDPGRTERLVAVLSDLQSQVFVTTTHPRYLGRLPADDTVTVEVSGGQLSPG